MHSVLLVPDKKVENSEAPDTGTARGDGRLIVMGLMKLVCQLFKPASHSVSGMENRDRYR